MRRVAVAAAVVLTVGAVVGVPPALAGSGDAGVVWHGCATGPDDPLGAALDEAGAQCGRVRVPVDYRQPRGRSIDIALARVRATDPARRRGVLVVNPGGPGVPGMEQVLLAGAVPEVAARYDFVGVDPRFVGRSAPLRCDWDTDTFLRSAGPDRRTFTESADLARRLAAGCATDRDLLPFASTRNTARDLDLVRQALGEERISYLGVSYGTYLGAVYLQLFGAHADRFVLDSAVDPTVYGPGLLRRSAPAITAALRNWAGSAAARELGADTDAVLATVNRVDQAATRRPLRVGQYSVDGHVLPYLLLAGLYDDSPEAQADLTATVRTLDAAARGVDVTPPPALDRTLAGVLTGAGPATDRAGTPILCADRAVSRDPATYFRDIQAHRADEPLFGPLTRNTTPCAFWPVRPVEPPTTINTGAPVLVVGADGDPVTPHAGQLALHRALPGSRLVTLRGAFRHGVYLAAGNTCVDTAVRDHLLGGALPATDLTCG
ncbi:alpha/beta hydrolase [Actinokineospora spheciospongiae]|uniref:alpha/beta hydrolase n=1 Tax=Actinokineospora spheciospongiae TaxID=909613 RepID=UPI000D9708D5|nr:alpha/beta hydrolase [Actinokineospora spheciospongiae]PWW63325.1 alpha/beta hydrolase family protein [Actinokineospora spheciospongiae]